MFIRLLALIGCLAGASLVSAPAGATPPLPGEKITAGISAGGVDVSGLTADEAAAKVRAVHGERIERGRITVQAADLTWVLKAQQARARLDLERTAKRAVYAGRGSGGRQIDVPLAVTYSKSRVRSFARKIDKRLYRSPRNSRLKISVRRVRVTHSRRGRDINSRQLEKQIRAALADPRLSRVMKPKLIRRKPKLNANALRRTAGTVITIDQSTFKLRLFKQAKLVRTYRVAVGQPAWPTPRGRFRITSKQVNPVWSVPNSPWAGELAGSRVAGGSAANPLKARWMGIVNGIGIHGTGQGYSIGTRASHGCIRMHVGDVIALFERVPVGTPVLIA